MIRRWWRVHWSAFLFLSTQYFHRILQILLLGRSTFLLLHTYHSKIFLYITRRIFGSLQANHWFEWASPPLTVTRLSPHRQHQSCVKACATVWCVVTQTQATQAVQAGRRLARKLTIAGINQEGQLGIHQSSQCRKLSFMNHNLENKVWLSRNTTIINISRHALKN